MLKILRRIFFREKAVTSLPAGGNPGTGVMGTGPGGWVNIIREPFTGAWQRNMEINPAKVSGFFADFACKTLISRDIAKLPLRLVRQDDNGIWNEVFNPSYSPVLRKPNHYQTRNQFVECWILSKLARGNTYVLKARDNRGVVTRLYVLDPRRVTPMISEDGSVFYKLSTDDLNVTGSEVMVPASEIIHDRFNCDHWLIGIPPVYASGLASMQGLNIQNQSAALFRNNAQPSGILTAPGEIDETTVERLERKWRDLYSGENYGKIAILGDNLKFEKLALTAVEGQLVEQLKMTAEMVCSSYHVPAFMIGAGPEPATGSAQERTLRYYTQCLQSLIEDFESCLDEGLGLLDKPDLGVEFDVENLLRMDSVAQMEFLERGRNYFTPNEGRKKLNLPPKEGGDSVYRQQQDFSLEALAKRDAQADPFATAPSAPSDEVRAMAERIPELERLLAELKEAQVTTLADAHRGIWQPGVFHRGQMVTMRGSTWLCYRQTTQKPGAGDDWRMIVKAGRDAPEAPAQ